MYSYQHKYWILIFNFWIWIRIRIRIQTDNIRSVCNLASLIWCAFLRKITKYTRDNVNTENSITETKNWFSVYREQFGGDDCLRLIETFTFDNRKWTILNYLPKIFFFFLGGELFRKEKPGLVRWVTRIYNLKQK